MSSSDEAPTPATPDNPQPDPWAPPEDRVPTPPTVTDGIPLPTPQDAIPSPRVSLGKDAAPTEPVASAEPLAPASRDPWIAPNDPPTSGPAPLRPSVHDQQTVTSIPGVDVGAAAPTSTNAQVSPVTGAPTAPEAPQPWAGPGPFAVPGGQQPLGGQTPFPGSPFAPPTPGASLPPPPIGPEGPGQVPYGYPQYPGVHVHGGVGHHAPGYHPVGYGWPGMGLPPSNGIGITAMVLGIVSATLFCVWPLAILAGILAVIFGFIGRGKVNRGEATNPGHALTGIICGAVGLLLGIGFIVLLVVASDSSSDGTDTDPYYYDDGFSTSLALVLTPAD